MPAMRRQSARNLALRERVRREAARVAEAAQQNANRIFERAIRRYESKVRELEYRPCAECRRRVEKSNLSRNLCSSCRGTRERADLLFTAANGMDIGEIPPALTGLTLIEQILIARVNPVVSVFRVRGQQRAYSGHVMNFVQHVDQIASRLPHDPANLSAILILHRTTPDGIVQFRVRSNRVRQALIWLKANNQYYTDINIDEGRLRDLPQDGNIANRLPNAPLADEAVADQPNPNPAENADQNVPGEFHPSCYPNLPALDVNNVIELNIRRRLENNQRIEGEVDLDLDWPEIERDPMNEFSSEGIICKAFPCLFPYGRGDLHHPRMKKITNHKYFKYLMQYYDGRFANDARFPYYAFNSLARWDALNCGNVFVRQHQLINATADEFRQLANNPNRDLASSIMYYGTSLRGTRPFWKQRSGELMQMCRQIGTPTIFFTLSAADYYWPDLFRALRPNLNPNSLNLQERRKLMHDNPYMVAMFFEARINIFIKEFLAKVFEIQDHWFRYEWQHRGSPHVHGLLWLEGAPDRDDLDSMGEAGQRLIVDYFKQFVKATVNFQEVAIQSNPCCIRYSDLLDGDRPDDLDRLLSSVQRHSRCGVYCQRKRRGSNVIECRYKFPMPLEDDDCLRKVDGYWQFIPMRNDALIQRYNPLVTQAWRGNTDFSAITSRESVLRYIAKYASKGEQSSPAFAQVLNDCLSRNRGDTPAATIVRKLLISSVAERNYSAQEIMHLVMGLPLYHCSRQFQILSLENSWRRLDQQNTNRLIPGYSSRPVSLDGEFLDEITLYDFVKKYNVSPDRSIRERSVEVIVMVQPYLQPTGNQEEDERFYKNQCMLRIPWRGDFETILGRGRTWSELYHDAFPLIDRPIDPFEGDFPDRPVGEYEQDSDDEGADMRRNAGEALARIQPAGRVSQQRLGRRPIDDAHGWEDFNTVNFTQAAVNEFLSSYKQAPSVEPNIDPQIIPFDRMSAAQQDVMSICRAQIDNQNHDTRLVLVQGKAGTGKSVVIRAMCRLLDERFPAKSYQVLAPTGQAAVNVDGTTLHSFLKIPAKTRTEPLNGPALRNFQLPFRDGVRFIIIDEYSMIGLKLLHSINLRLREATGRSNELFGGLFVYLFGDVRQLPPVQDTPIYSAPHSNEAAIAKELINQFRPVILTVSQRQGDSEAAFKAVLDGLAIGQISQEGWQLLMSRRDAVAPNQQEFANAINLYPTNEAVRQHNERLLSNNGNPVALIAGEHTNTTSSTASSTDAGGLQKELYLSVGCRVMLRKNLCVAKGLVNGSLGTVRQIVYNLGERPPSLPYAVFVEFDRFTGPYFHNRTFPIRPMCVTWKDRNVDCSRRQIPLNLAYALTIHKSQGLTLDKVVVELGDREQAAGQTYVALSRCRRLNDLLILRGCNYTRLASLRNNRKIIERNMWISDIERRANDE